ESWAILASLVSTAKLHDLDPQAYLSDVLERIVSRRTKSHQLHELLAGTGRLRASAPRRPQHERASPFGIAVDGSGRHAARRARAMAAGPCRPASCRRQCADAGWLRGCDRGRAGVD